MTQVFIQWWALVLEILNNLVLLPDAVMVFCRVADPETFGIGI
jgi:hypothetical protein